MLLSLGMYAQSELADCNDALAIRAYLAAQGFESSPITITGATATTDLGNVRDFARLAITNEGTTVDLINQLKSEIAPGASEGFNTAAVITKNENFCDQAVKTVIYNDFDKDQYHSSVNIHIWDNPNSDNDLLLKRVNPIDISKLNSGN